MREGAEWVDDNDPALRPVVVGGAEYSVRSFINPGRRLVPLAAVKSGQIKDLGENFYYIARPRWELPGEFASCPKVYAVKRQRARLTIVRHCDGVTVDRRT